tara:strand:- start:1806 stop:4301 length:2496 start_codon:yes stop_codon:yes gene_type:complete
MFFYTNVYGRGNHVYFRGFKDGERINQKIPFQPSLYTRCSKESQYKSVEGYNLKRVKFKDMQHCKSYIKKYRDVTNFPIYGNTNYGYQLISKFFPNDVEYDQSHIKIQTLDIETSTEYGFPDPRKANESVLLITIQDFNTKEITTFGSKPYLSQQENVKYVLCKDEYDLLRKFINFIKADFPDIITGWNVQLFDIAYLSSRIIKVLGQSALQECSPYNSIREYEVPYAKGRTQLAFDWHGISTLDYMQLYKKFAYKTLESYALDFVAKEELQNEKIKHNYGSFKEFYTKDWNLFVEYNIVDVELVDRLEEKMKLINLIITMAYNAKCNYIDIFSSVRTWDCIIYNHLHKKNIIPENPFDSEKKKENDRMIMGAFVKDPKPEKYDWVVSFDATSLYPSIMMTFNMSPDTLIDRMKHLNDDEKSIQKLINGEVVTNQLFEDDVTMVANGQCFRKDKMGMLPELINYYFDMRQKVKKEMIDAQKRNDLEHVTSLNSKQMAAKILMNSLYGASGNIYFRFYDTRIAEGITMTGQYIIRYVAKKLNEYLNKVCKTKDVEYSFYSDTDSTYITLGKFVEQNFSGKSNKEIVDLLNKFCDQSLSKVIDKACDDIFKYLNVYDEKITFKREVIADSGVWLAKKRYALNVHDSEGVVYDPPRIKVQGMEIVRSSTPQSVRTALKECVGIVLTKDEETLKKFVTDMEERWHKLTPQEIAFPRTVNNVGAYSDPATIFRKGTPIHVKGALMFNHLIRKNDLEVKHQLLYEGDKIKFLYLKEPNPIGINVITFQSEIPKVFGLEKYLNYDLQFQKAFLDPLDSLIKCVGWEIKEQASLEWLFE